MCHGCKRLKPFIHAPHALDAKIIDKYLLNCSLFFGIKNNFQVSILSELCSPWSSFGQNADINQVCFQLWVFHFELLIWSLVPTTLFLWWAQSLPRLLLSSPCQLHFLGLSFEALAFWCSSNHSLIMRSFALRSKVQLLLDSQSGTSKIKVPLAFHS